MNPRSKRWLAAPAAVRAVAAYCLPAVAFCSAALWALAAGAGEPALVAPSSPEGAAPEPPSAGLLALPPHRFEPRLDGPALGRYALLRGMMDASTERLGPVRRYTSSPWGSWRSQPWLRLAWAEPASTDERPPSLLAGSGPASTPLASLAAPEAARLAPAFDLASLVERPRVGDLLPIERAPATFESTGLSLASDGFGVLWTPPPKVVKDWRCRRRPVTISRVGGEVRSFPLLRCDGSIEPGALERLSVLMRPPDAIVPDGELPEEPDASARAGEWLPQVRIAQPRLVWLLQSVADAFPFKPIYIHSGYRPPYDERSKRPGTHASLHGMGRAVDIQVVGVSAATLLEVCRKLDDVGCGYYPNSTFVHVDVRKPGTGHALWIDVSGPGEPARYVDSWPGVVEKGSNAWAPGTRASDPSGEPGRVLPPGMGGAQAPP